MFKQSAPVVPPANLEVSAPTLPTVESNVLVPLAQAAITGVLGGVAVGLVGYALLGLPVEVVAPVAIFVLIAVAWGWRLWSCDQTLWRTETRLGVDLNHDGSVGKPEPHPFPVNPAAGRVVAEQRAEREYRERMAKFVHACAANSDERKRARDVSRAQYREWRDLLIRAGHARWLEERNHLRGWELTAAPGDVLAQMFGGKSS